MVRSTIIVSALFALVASVTAVPRPHGSVVGIDADYIGTGDINLQGAGNHVANANNVCVHDIGQDIKVGHRKREEARTVRISRQAGTKNGKSSMGRGKSDSNNEA